MTGSAALVLCGVLLVAVSVGWRLSWLAMRIDRAHVRAERTWAALDAALVRRAHRAVEIAADPRLEPVPALVLAGAARHALRADLSHADREAAESRLSHLLAEVDYPGPTVEQHRAALARRLYNDAVANARSLRSRPGVRLLRLAGHAQLPAAFEIADFDPAARPRGTPADDPIQLVWRQSKGGTRGFR
jgi:hypothetical protein